MGVNRTSPYDEEETAREHDSEDGRSSSGRKISRDDLQDLAKVGSDLLKKTIVSGFDIFKEVSKELPKEAQHFISARKEQVLQNMTKDIAQVMLTNAMEKFFKLVREHRLEVSFRIVRDQSSKKADEHSHAPGTSGRNDKGASQGQNAKKSKGPSMPFSTKNRKHDQS